MDRTPASILAKLAGTVSADVAKIGLAWPKSVYDQLHEALERSRWAPKNHIGRLIWALTIVGGGGVLTQFVGDGPFRNFLKEVVGDGRSELAKRILVGLPGQTAPGWTNNLVADVLRGLADRLTSNKEQQEKS